MGVDHYVTCGKQIFRLQLKRFGRFSVLIGFVQGLLLMLIVRKKRVQTTFITLNSTPKSLFTAADLT